MTPKDILTKEDPWINRADLLNNYDQIVEGLPNIELRDQLDNYLISRLSENPTKKEKREAIEDAIRRHPAIIEYFIKSKEDKGDAAVAISDLRVQETEQLFISQVADLIQILQSDTKFYELSASSNDDTLGRIYHLKDVIENKGGAHLLYLKGEPLSREKDLHLLFRLTWCGMEPKQDDSMSTAISRTSWDKTFVEFKLAANKQLKSNLEKMLEIQDESNDVGKAIRVIIYFDDNERHRVNSMLDDLNLASHPDVILIDGRSSDSKSTNAADSSANIVAGRRMKDFQRALLSAFRTPSDLGQMVRFELDMNLPEITTANGLAQQTFDLITRMEALDQIDQLIEAAYSANNSNTLLTEFVMDYCPEIIEKAA